MALCNNFWLLSDSISWHGEWPITRRWWGMKKDCAHSNTFRSSRKSEQNFTTSTLHIGAFCQFLSGLISFDRKIVDQAKFCDFLRQKLGIDAWFWPGSWSNILNKIRPYRKWIKIHQCEVCMRRHYRHAIQGGPIMPDKYSHRVKQTKRTAWQSILLYWNYTWESVN